MSISTNRVEIAKRELGELFIMGFSGLELSDETSAFLSQARIGGVILFTPNYESPAQVATLINQVQDCRGELPLWVSVDHEGGKVQRFKTHFTKIPDAATLIKKDSPKLLFELSEMIARELKAVGINVNFAPVADINSNPSNPVIGVRAFGATDEQVSKMISGFVRGHITEGVQPCVKHFPGHGDTTVDSHFELPKVNHTLEELRERELKPFSRGFKSGCRMVMSAHVLNPNLDEKYPATLSKKTLDGLLRQDLRYTGLIVSDDMEMQAITDNFGAEEAPRLAIEAGCDLLCYRSEKAARHAYASLLKALDEGRLNPERVIESAKRSKDMKAEAILPYEPVNPAECGKKIGTEENAALLAQLL